MDATILQALIGAIAGMSAAVGVMYRNERRAGDKLDKVRRDFTKELRKESERCQKENEKLKIALVEIHSQTCMKRACEDREAAQWPETIERRMHQQPVSYYMRNSDDRDGKHWP